MVAGAPIMSESRYSRAEQRLRERWYSQPALALAEVRRLWGPRPWPDLVRYRVICYPGDADRDYLVSHLTTSLADARRYVVSLRNLGVGRPGPMEHRTLHITRNKLLPGHILLRTNIPVLMKRWEPPDTSAMIALLYRPSGRVRACYEHGWGHRFESLRECLAFYHRDAAWLDGREAFHLSGQ